MGKLTKIERRRRSKKILLNFIILIILISLIIVFSLKSSLFNVDGFKIKGNNKLTNEQIIKTSSINKGDNIFKIDKNGSKDNIEKIPYIKSVSIDRKLPNKVEINVVERKTILLIQKLSTFLAIDEEGFILEQIDENKEKKPILYGFNIENVKLGDNIFSIGVNNDIIDFIVESFRLNLLEDFDKIDFKIVDNIDIQLKDGIDVAFGPPDNVKYKLKLLDEILKDTKNKNINFTKIIMNKGVNPILVTED